MPDEITVEYDLFALPTAQHRAGLAGLVLTDATMSKQGLPDVPQLQLDDGHVKLTLSQKSLTALLNYLYEASVEEMSSGTLRKDRQGQVVPPIRTEQRNTVDQTTGKTKTQTVHIYPQVVPRARPLESLGMPQPWLKLWRDVIWSGVRAVPRTRIPYEERSQSKDISEAAHLWADVERARKHGSRTAELAGSLFLGAQACSPDGIPFVGKPADNLLLHFWPVVSRMGEPRETTVDKGVVKEGPIASGAYAIAVPDVADLNDFLEDFPGTVASLDIAMVGYRPRGAILALPAEAGLQFLGDLIRLASSRAIATKIRYSVSGFELFVLIRRGRNVVHLERVERVPAEPRLANEYEAIAKSSRNLLFRRQRIRNLLDGVPWYRDFDRLFSVYPSDAFLQRGSKGFSSSASKKFWDEYRLGETA